MQNRIYSIAIYEVKRGTCTHMHKRQGQLYHMYGPSGHGYAASLADIHCKPRPNGRSVNAIESSQAYTRLSFAILCPTKLLAFILY